MVDSSVDSKGTATQPKLPRQWGGLAGTFWAIFAYLAPSALLASLFHSLHIFRLDQNDVASQFAVQAFLELASMAIIWGVIRLYRRDWSTIGLARPRLAQLGLAVLAYPVYLIASIGLALLAKSIVPSLNLEQTQDIGFYGAISGWQLVLVFIALVVIPPLTEEILFRGFLLTGYLKHFGPIVSALVVSLIFGVAHGQPNVALDTFTLSLFLCYLRFRTNNLWPSVALHALKNLIPFIYLFIIGAR